MLHWDDKEHPEIRQVAALPYRIDASGAVSVLLITSRETRRWVVPKGNPIRGLASHEAAAHEAFEEAGVSGIPCPTPLGSYGYDKRRRNGGIKRATVALFPLAVTSQAEDWPEQDERDSQWFTLKAAAAAVDEPDLGRLIENFRIARRPVGKIARLKLWAETQGGRMPMLRWFQALMPKQGRFFELFEDHSATLVAGADALARLLQSGADVAAHVAEIRDQEHKADDITRDVLQDVRRILITPFDRTAITGLISVMDDSIDQMNQTAKAITLYELTEFEPQMRDMSGIIVEAARVTAEVIPLLRSIGDNATRILELTARLVELEGHADEIHDAGLKALYKATGDSRPMTFIVDREIYTHLERVVDRFEDVANEIQGLVLDHA
jgi:predicted phosphate transport protein (TIGR00153 family)